jgi:Restriction endonuclease
MLDLVAEQCLSHFLCRFDPASRKRLTEDVVREAAQPLYSQEVVEQFIDNYLVQFQTMLVEEYNQRLADNRPLRFQIADGGAIGKIVEGSRTKKLSKEIRFQNALRRVSPTDFEILAAIVLRVLGCEKVFSTPASHDQGLDAFGYQSLVRPTPYGVTHELMWIAQAKHHQKGERVTTRDVRELVGSRELLLARVFSTVGDRYKELRLLSQAPTAVALVTTEEIPATVRRLTDRAGVFVFASSDLFHLLRPSLKKKYTVAAIRSLIRNHSATIRTLD